MKPWFGFHMPNYTYPDVPPEKLFDHVVEQAKTAEQLGFSLVTVMDHLFQIGGVGPEDNAMLEAYTVLGALARETSKVKLGTLVTGVTYRNLHFWPRPSRRSTSSPAAVPSSVSAPPGTRTSTSPLATTSRR